MSEPLATVYRIYAADNALLYIGCSKNVDHRLKYKHRHAKWWADVDRVERDHPLPPAAGAPLLVRDEERREDAHWALEDDA